MSGFWGEWDEDGYITTLYYNQRPNDVDRLAWFGEGINLEHQKFVWTGTTWHFVEDMDAAKKEYRQKIKTKFSAIEEHGELGGLYSPTLDAQIYNAAEDIDKVSKIIAGFEAGATTPTFYKTKNKGLVSVSGINVFKAVYLELYNRYIELWTQKENFYSKIDACKNLYELKTAYSEMSFS